MGVGSNIFKRFRFETGLLGWVQAPELKNIRKQKMLISTPSPARFVITLTFEKAES